MDTGRRSCFVRRIVYGLSSIVCRLWPVRASQHHYHCAVDQPVAREDLWRINMKRSTEKVRNSSARLFDQNDAAGDIPGTQSVLPETVETPAGNISEVECC